MSITKYFDLADSFLSSFEEPSHNFFSCIFLYSGLNFADRNFYSNCMHVHHALIAWRDKLLLFRELKNGNVGLEFSWLLAVVEVVADHISSCDVILFNVFDFHLDIFTSTGKRHSLVLGIEDLLNDHLQTLRQDSHRLVFNYSSWLDFTINKQVSDVFELVNNRNTQRTQRFTFR